MPGTRTKSGGGPRRLSAHAAGMTAMQRLLGNAAMNRLIRSAGAQELRMVQWLAREALRAGRFELFERFEQLTAGQKAAVLKLIAHLAGGPGPAPSGIDWDIFEQCLDFVQDVQLEEDEAAVEADIAEEGGKAEIGTVNTSGLLPPYDKIVRWLNYKAHKQGKAEWMRMFASLDLDQKKLAIHRMVKGKARQVNVETLRETLSIRLREKIWLDWDAVREAIRGAEEVDFRGLDARERQAMLEADDEEAHADAALFPVPLLPDKAGRKDEDKPVSVTLVEEAERIAALFLANQPEAVIDLCLGIPEDAAGDVREEERRKRLAAQGFASPEQYFRRIVDEWAAICFERGVRGGTKLFVRFIGLMGFKMIRGKHPLPGGISARLLARAAAAMRKLR